MRHGSGDAVTLIEYSLAGDVTKVTLPDGSFLAYAYDDARRLTVVASKEAAWRPASSRRSRAR